VRIITGGGGGWGEARSREAEHIRRDVEDGYISRETARTLYGFEERVAG
jgi:N-methylhydantoinase B